MKNLKEMARHLFGPFLKSPYIYRGSIDKRKTTDPELCSICKGRCCKNCGCFLSPQDFSKISYKVLNQEIQKGYISIDYVWKKNYEKKGTLVLRIRNVGSPIVDIKRSSKPHQCMMLTPNGCSFSYEERPLGGKLLIPLVNDKGYAVCYPRYSYIECAREWEPYKRILRKLYFKYRNIDY